MKTTFSADNSVKYTHYKLVTALYSPSSSKPQPLPTFQGNVFPPFNKHEIDKNNALKRLYNALTVLSYLVTGGLLIWLFTFSNTLSQEQGNQKARIDDIQKVEESLKQEKIEMLVTSEKIFAIYNEPNENKHNSVRERPIKYVLEKQFLTGRFPLSENTLPSHPGTPPAGSFR